MGDSDGSDAQDRAEALDSDRLPGDHDDPDIEPEYPLDELIGAEDYGLTSAEEEIDEPLAERIARESPDPLVVELESELRDEDRRAAARAGHRADGSEADESGADGASDELDGETRESIGNAGAQRTLLDDGSAGDEEPSPSGVGSSEQIGRLVAPDTDGDGFPIEDDEGDSVGSAVDGDDLSAEEEAMHYTTAPRFGLDGADDADV